jgi:hypothetical protein
MTGLLTAILAACTTPVLPDPATVLCGDQTGIAGLVTDSRGQPSVGAYVYAYRNRRSNLRGPADFEAQTDHIGRYFLDVIAGEYYLVARMRREGVSAGPPLAGDAWAMPALNPVQVESGRCSRVDLQLHPMVQSMGLREGTLTSGTTGFTGRILDAHGRPAVDALVLAYRDHDVQRMPDFTSLPVDAAGRFTLYLPEPGAYCLVARTRLRGQPSANEPHGVPESASDGCLPVEKDQILDIGTIVLKPYRR